ncbi:hypothetical protein Plhal304r1_c015g0055031 [Plasmopara halstedii]
MAQSSIYTPTTLSASGFFIINVSHRGSSAVSISFRYINMFCIIDLVAST